MTSTWRLIHTSPARGAWNMAADEAILLIGYLLTSALIFWRRNDDWLALYLTLTLVLITPQLSYSWYYLSLTAPFWDKLLPLLIAFSVAMTLPNFYLLPPGRFVPRLTIVLAAVWVVACLMEVMAIANWFIPLVCWAVLAAIWLAA